MRRNDDIRVGTYHRSVAFPQRIARVLYVGVGKDPIVRVEFVNLPPDFRDATMSKRSFVEFYKPERAHVKARRAARVME